ncbi:hypothetical protein FQA47_015481 [Oryzias melastigma]|uniref:Uncharacterized protein n=1 Tax=Oryzias melastigma TaxID=30732 RepID=A0A834FQH5_ORYME|nr:hypothetical protein FQA47_015481 [Oryzias melastigma]
MRTEEVLFAADTGGPAGLHPEGLKSPGASLSSMHPPGAPRILLEPRASSWSSAHPPGAPRILLEPHACSWSSTHPPGAPCILLELRASSWSSTHAPGAPCILLERPGDPRIFLGLCRPARLRQLSGFNHLDMSEEGVDPDPRLQQN